MSTNKKNGPWSAEDASAAVELRRLKYRIKTIARVLDRSVRSVRGLLLRRDIRRSNDGQQWLQLLKAPHVTREVAAKMGVSVRVVMDKRHYLRKKGIKVFVPTRSKYSPQALADAIKKGA